MNFQGNNPLGTQATATPTIGHQLFSSQQISKFRGNQHGSQFAGRCSFNKGCQCWNCYMLNFETARRRLFLSNGQNPFMNNENSVCTVSFSQAHPNGHFQMGYKFYCGRRGKSYHNYDRRLCDCDGACGPNDGCQCESCYQLDELCVRLCNQHLLEEIARRKRLLGVSESEEFVNSIGSRCQVRYCYPTKDGHIAPGYKFYCGRNVGRHQYMPFHMECTCDGVCGPENGCQCVHCYALEQKLILPELVKYNVDTLKSTMECDDFMRQLDAWKLSVSAKKEELKRLERPTNESSQESAQCVICMNAPKNVAIIPCGHVATCTECFTALNSSARRVCPLCNGNIQSHITVFI